MKLHHLLIACLITFNARSPEAWALDQRDATGEYMKTWRQIDAEFGDPQVERLRRYKLILVPGFLSDLVINSGAPGNPCQADKHFDDQMCWLERLAVPYQRITMQADESLSRNAEILEEAIAASEQDVILISHSKGGIDSLEALLNRPAARQKVKGWISIQAPFFGSLLADWALKEGIRPLVQRALREHGKSIESLESMQTLERKAYYRLHKEEIDSLVGELPVLSFSSWKEEEGGGQAYTVFSLLRGLLFQWLGVQNDGMVPLASQVLPGTDFVRIPSLSHDDPVMPQCVDFDRVRFTKTLLSMLLKRLELSGVSAGTSPIAPTETGGGPILQESGLRGP
ncbi:MAG: hypothetical protein HY611_10355 [Elusimicrobia bacterium]|nr:hypothetical protein [Elusimicrobiota bacterium]